MYPTKEEVKRIAAVGEKLRLCTLCGRDEKSSEFVITPELCSYVYEQ